MKLRRFAASFGWYTRDFELRSDDPSRNMVRVGDAVSEELQKAVNRVSVNVKDYLYGRIFFHYFKYCLTRAVICTGIRSVVYLGVMYYAYSRLLKLLRTVRTARSRRFRHGSKILHSR